MTEETKEKNVMTLGAVRLLVGNQSNGPLVRLLQLELPLRAAWRLKKIKDRVMAEFDITEDMRKKLIEKYGTKDENGATAIQTKEGIENFTTEFNELLAEEVEISYEAVEFTLFGDIKLSTLELELLEDCGIIKME